MQEYLLEQVIADQKINFRNKDLGVERDIDFEKILQTDRIVVITGIRRSGKSTLLQQVAIRLHDYYYINFDDERLFNFELEDFQKLMILFQKTGKTKNILIDEIQNIKNWERFVRRIYDEGYKIFITGSNAKLLSSELSTHLTGRYKRIELFPFSFAEYVIFKGINIVQPVSNDIALILRALDEYIIGGGFPEYARNKDIEDLQSIYSDIIYKDLIARFSIKNQKSFKNLAHYLFSNFTKEISYNSLKRLTNISNANTIKDYIEYLQQAYLLFECYKYDYSLRKQIIYNKKVYVIDNGMRNAIAVDFSRNSGQYIENVVYIELKRRQKQVYYYKTKNNYEVDFIVHENPVILIQVSYTLQNIDTAKREKRALFSAMKELSLQKGMIVTYNEELTITENDKEIKVIPLWKFLLNL